MKVIYPMDTTPFFMVAIGKVVKNLVEAIVLVFLVIYLFIGNIRATLIPTLAVPVVILGTFAVLGLFGFSINDPVCFVCRRSLVLRPTAAGAVQQLPVSRSAFSPCWG
jgi:hypothetical protein